MTTFSQTSVWHDVFAQSPPDVLSKLLAADMVPLPCVHEDGQDLLLTFLGRAVPEAVINGFRVSPMKEDPRLNELRALATVPEGWRDRLAFQAVALALLDRSDVTAWSSTVQPDAARALDLAVEGNLVAVVEHLFQKVNEGEKRAIVEHASKAGWVHKAASKNQFNLLCVLLENGCSATSVDPSGRTPLFHARNVRVAERLIEAGASLSERAGKVGLLDHWARELRAERYGNSGLSALLEMGVAQSQEPGSSDDATLIKAVAWFESVTRHVSLSQGQQSFANMESTWADGWVQNMEPALAIRPAMHAWSRQQNSGLLKGKVTLPAAMGGLWLSAGPNASGYPAHLGLMEKPERLFGDQPSLVRKGVTDWGLFALGALLAKPRFNQLEHARIKELATGTAAAIERIQKAKGSPEQWLGWALETAATLQRPKNLNVWRGIGSCLEALLDKRLNDETTKQRSAHGGTALALLQGHLHAWQAAWSAIESGVRMCSGVKSIGLLNRVTEWGKMDSLTSLAALPRQKYLEQWTVMALITVCDHAAVVELEKASSSAIAAARPHSFEKGLLELVKLLDQRSAELGDFPTIPAVFQPRLDEAMARVKEWGGQALVARWESLRLDQTLEQISSEEPVVRKPRF